MTATARRPDMEWLRVAGMLLVFSIHAAMPFNPWDSWHITNADRSKWLGAWIYFLAPWIMPLFMMLAGESAYYALRERGARAYVRARLLRIGLPLVAGVLLLVPPQVYLERRLRGQFDGSLAEFYPHFFEGGIYGVHPRGNFSWHHLWFLAFLLAFALVTLPVFRWLLAPRGRRVMARFAARCEGPAGLLWLVAPVVVLKLALAVTFWRHPRVAYDWSGRTLLLPAFVGGFVLAAEPGVLRAVGRHWRSALASGIAASAGLLAFAWPGNVLERLPSPRSAGGVLLWGAFAAAGWCWLVALLGAARSLTPRSSPALAHTARLVYPFYVLHQPLVVAAAFVAVQWSAGIAAKLAAVSACSFVATVAACELAARWGPTRALVGLRPQARTG
jgi:glucans biosynthesis protein C